MGREKPGHQEWRYISNEIAVAYITILTNSMLLCYLGDISASTESLRSYSSHEPGCTFR